MTVTRRVMVTGGSGLLGRQVVHELRRRADIVTLAPSRQDLDLRDATRVDGFISDQRVDVLIHLAADCGGIGYNMANPASLMWSNSTMALAVFEAARRHGVARIVSAGSCDSYPAQAPVPWPEDSLWDGLPEPTSAAYGLAKRYMISMGEAYRQQYGLCILHLIFINMFGEDDHFDVERGHLIPAMVSKIDAAVRNGAATVRARGTGTPIREMLYAADAARLIVRAIDRPDVCGYLNAGSGSVHSVREIVEYIAMAMGFDGEIIFDPSASDGHPRKILDSSRLMAGLGRGFVFTPFEAALRRTVDSFRARRQ